MNTTQKDIATRIVAITVSELNGMVPDSIVKGLRIRISANRRRIGLATYHKNEIMVSTYSLKKSIHFVRWLVCHEVAHLVIFNQGNKKEHHGRYFKKIERQFCKAFGIQLAYSNGHERAYPSGIFGPNGHFERFGN